MNIPSVHYLSCISSSFSWRSGLEFMWLPFRGLETRAEKPPSHMDHSGSGLRQGLWLGWNPPMCICDHGAIASCQTHSLLNHNMTNVSVVGCSDRIISKSLSLMRPWGCVWISAYTFLAQFFSTCPVFLHEILKRQQSVILANITACAIKRCCFLILLKTAQTPHCHGNPKLALRLGYFLLALEIWANGKLVQSTSM